MLTTDWYKSSYSGASANCVETCLRTLAHPVVGLRDTQNREAGQLNFTTEEWAALLGGVCSEAR